MTSPRQPGPPLSICVLTYGDHADLVERCLESIRRQTRRPLYRLIVGANAPGAATLSYLRRLRRQGQIDRLHLSPTNINKCPMMRRMFRGVRTPFICWFDDDSYLTRRGALERCLAIARRSSAKTVMWGQLARCNHAHEFINLPNPQQFVRTASWYRGLTPPSWTPGGRGEFDFRGQGTGNGQWVFVLGGFWLIRTSAIRALDWPDRRLIKLGDDVLLGEALRQQGWEVARLVRPGISIDDAPRRGDTGLLPEKAIAHHPARAVAGPPPA